MGPTGNDAVVEAVAGGSQFLSGVRYRDAQAHHFQLFENGGETDLFLHTASSRVNSPAFSPDGQHIMVTEGYALGALAYTASHPDLSIINSLDIVPVSSQSTSYIVPIDIKEQPMPPAQYSENIRPVFAANNSGLSTVGFVPIAGISWTPVID